MKPLLWSVARTLKVSSVILYTLRQNRFSCPRCALETGDFILLADADKEHVEAVRSTLKEEDGDVDVVVVHDGKEALYAALGVGRFVSSSLKKPLFVLVDLTLPKLNGHVVLRLLRLSRYGKSTPIIAMIASEDETAKAESAAVGATEIIPKPIQRSTIKALLRKYRRPTPRRARVRVFNASA